MDQHLDSNEGVGATKICDSLYIGDQLAAKDIDTIVMNHITHIVNCSANEVPNHFESYGIRYLSYCWTETDKDIILDQQDRILREVANFIEEAREMGESCLIHTLQGYSTSFTLFAGYFMQKYQWTLYKVLEFLDSRVPKVEIKNNSFKQLKLLQSRLLEKHPNPTNDWVVKPINPDQLIMRNTFVNVTANKKMVYTFPMQPSSISSVLRLRKKTLTWKDEKPPTKLNESKVSEFKDRLSIRPKSILKVGSICDGKVLTEKAQSQKKSQKHDAEESRQGSIYKLSVKKKIPPAPTPPLPVKPEQRKVIHLFANQIMARGGSEKKISEKDKLEAKRLPREGSVRPSEERVDKVSSTRSSYMKNAQSPMIRQTNTLKPKNVNDKRVLKSEMSEKEPNIKSEKLTYDYPPFITLFKNDSFDRPQKLKRQILNKSAETLHQQPQYDKRLRFETEVSEVCPKDELAKKLIKKMMVQKAKLINEDKENKQSAEVRAKHSEDNQLFRLDRGFLTLNLKTTQPNESSLDAKTQKDRFSQDDRQKPIRRTDNFVQQESSYKTSINKSLRAQSPSTKISQSRKHLERMKMSFNLKGGNGRISSPAVYNNAGFNLRQANAIISTIFSKDIYKPKWKF